MMDDMKEMECKRRLEMCITILNEYSWLLDSYILDFFAENHMEKLPKSWCDHLKNIPLEDFYYLINFSMMPQIVWPLSLICLRVLIKFLQLPREFSINDVSLVQSVKTDSTRLLEIIKIKSPCFEHPKLRNYFLKHVKPKKQYEIYKMAAITAEVARKLDVKYVVDVGSGLGHLSRIMGYGFDLYVCSIETQTQLTVQAQEIDCEFERTASKYLNDLEFQNVKSKRPVHMNQTIRFNSCAEEFFQNVKKAFSLNEKNVAFGIVGLHPCGNLAATLLKLYVNCQEAKFINLVGCCYHKLSTSGESEHDIGFPLTDFCIQKHLNISYEARALACHAIESYCNRLMSKNHEHLKVHSYRAALENILKEKWPHIRKSALGNVKSKPGLTFRQYCKTALKKLNLTLSESDLESEETLHNLSEWQNVVKFYSLRLMLAPLIETAILLDRKIFLLERGFQCKIKAAFDPEISPRNQLLISQKVYE